MSAPADFVRDPKRAHDERRGFAAARTRFRVPTGAAPDEREGR